MRKSASNTSSSCVKSDAERFYELTTDMFCVMEPSGQVLRINSAWQRFGITLEMLQSQTLYSFIHPEDVDATRCQGARLRAGDDEQITFECRMRRADGEYRWVQWTGVLDRERDLIYTIARDVHEHKQRALALLQSETRTALAVDIAEMVTWEVDLASGSIRRRQGLPSASGQPDHVVSQSVDDWAERLHPEDRQRVVDTIRNAIDSRAGYSTDFRMPTSTGAVRWFSARGQIVVNDLGEPTTITGVTFDITQQREADEELKSIVGQRMLELESAGDEIRQVSRANEKLRHINQLLEYVGEGMYALDKDGVITYTNPAGASLFGRTVEELLGMPFHDLCHPAKPGGSDYPSDDCPIYDVMRSGTQYSSEDEIFGRKDGSSFPAECHTSPVYIDGIVVGLAVTLRDITERKRNQAKLRASEERYRRLLDTASEGVWLVDLDYRTTYVNKQVTQMLGYESEEMIGLHVEDLLFDEDRAGLYERIAKRKLGQSDEIDIRYRRKDGSEVWTITRINSLLDGNGNFEGALGMLTDITDRRSAQKQLQDSEARFRNVVETLNEGILITGRDDKVLYVNSRFAEITGYASEELTGKIAYELLLDESRWPEVQIRNLERVNGIHEQYEYTILKKDRSEIWVDIQATPFYDGEGNVIGTLSAMTDITERRAASKQLHDSEERFRNVAENLGEGILITDLDDRITYVNSRMAEITGYAMHEMVGRIAYQLLIAEDEWEQILNGNRDRAGGISDRYEIRIRCKDGSWLWTENKATPFRDSNGIVMGTLGAVTDIQLRKEAEEQLKASHEALEERVKERTSELGQRTSDLEIANDTLQYVNEVLRQREHALREAEQRLRAILANLPAAIFATDRDGRYTLCEGQALARLGNPGNVYGQSIFEVHQDNLSLLDNWRFACQCDTHFFSFQFGEYSFDSSTVALRDESGKITEVICLALDVTDRRAAEEQLEAQRQQIESQRTLLRNVIDTDPNFIFVKDREGHFILANRAVAEVYGTTPEGLVGKTDADFNPDPVEAARFLANDLAVMDSREDTLPYEESITDASLQTRWLQTVKRPFLIQDGQANYVLGISADITRLKQLQRQVIQSEKLAALGELVAGVAHEINNPLAAINGSAQLLELHPDERVRQKGSVIRRMSDRATRIVRSLLTFARGSGESRTPGSLNESIVETLEMCAYKLEKAGVSIELRLAEVDPWAMIKSNEIQQVVLNLINNAEHAVRDQPEGRRKIVISTEQWRDADNKSWSVIRVADTGYGIKPELLSRIFDPFFTTKDLGEGTGLGLSLCHGIIESHEGELTVESAEGSGATFTIRLPGIAEHWRKAA